MYSSVGLKPEQIFCIGKASKKLQEKATVSILSDSTSEYFYKDVIGLTDVV